MKILIGITYCIENELDHCISSLKKQTYTKFEYFIVEKLHKKQAMDYLYKTFMDASSSYGLFIKIDADMVLARPTFFEEVVDYMTGHSGVDDLQIGVHDFFTDRLVFGLHVFSNKMRWEVTSEKVFTDWPVANLGFNKVNDKHILAPAAYHCPDPSKFQSFHFGLHKAVKITQYDRAEMRYFASLVHWDNILKLAENFNRNNDNIYLAFALLGAYEGIKGRLEARHVDFDNQETLLIYKKWESQDDSEILRVAVRLRKLISILPHNLFLQLVIFSRNCRDGWWFAVNKFVENIKHNRLRNYQISNNM